MAAPQRGGHTGPRGLSTGRTARHDRCLTGGRHARPTAGAPTAHGPPAGRRRRGIGCLLPGRARTRTDGSGQRRDHRHVREGPQRRAKRSQSVIGTEQRGGRRRPRGPVRGAHRTGFGGRSHGPLRRRRRGHRNAAVLGRLLGMSWVRDTGGPFGRLLRAAAEFGQPLVIGQFAGGHGGRVVAGRRGPRRGIRHPRRPCGAVGRRAVRQSGRRGPVVRVRSRGRRRPPPVRTGTDVPPRSGGLGRTGVRRRPGSRTVVPVRRRRPSAGREDLACLAVRAGTVGGARRIAGRRRPAAAALVTGRSPRARRLIAGTGHGVPTSVGLVTISGGPPLDVLGAVRDPGTGDGRPRRRDRLHLRRRNRTGGRRPRPRIGRGRKLGVLPQGSGACGRVPAPAVDRLLGRDPEFLLGIVERAGGGGRPRVTGATGLGLRGQDRVPAVGGGRGRRKPRNVGLGPPGRSLRSSSRALDRLRGRTRQRPGRRTEGRRRGLGREDVVSAGAGGGSRPHPTLFGVPAGEGVGEAFRAVIVRRVTSSAHRRSSSRLLATQGR